MSIEERVRAMPVELGDLLSGTVRAVVETQEALDEYGRRRREEFRQAPEGSLVLPPIAYAFRSVAVEIEMSVAVGSTGLGPAPGGAAAPAARLFCRTLDPGSVGLYGYQASSGLRVRLLLEAQGFPEIAASRGAEDG